MTFEIKKLFPSAAKLETRRSALVVVVKNTIEPKSILELELIKELLNIAFFEH